VQVSAIIQKISIRSIDAKRFVMGPEAMRNTKITTSSSITSLHTDASMLFVGFVYSVDYYPNVASIKIEGEIRYADPPLEGIDVTNKKLPQALSREIHTAILRFCIPELVLLSKQLELIPPIPMPNMESKKEGYPKVNDNKYDYR